MYGCQDGDAGARIAIEVGDRRVESVIRQAHDPMPTETEPKGRSRVATAGPVPVKTWLPLKFAAVNLEKGHTQLVVRAVEIPGREAFELKEARIRRVE